MPEEEKSTEAKAKSTPKPKKPSQPKSPLIGAQAQPVTLDTTTKIGVDTARSLIDNVVEASIKGGLDIGALEDFTSISNSRDQIYALIDTMAADSSVSAILKTYAEEVCETADNGHVVWCEAPDSKVSKFVNYLLDVMNVDKNIYAWVYCLLKYGDVYLKLYRESDYKDDLFSQESIDTMYSTKTRLNESILDDKAELKEGNNETNEAVKVSIHSITDPYSYYVEMVPDPSTMFELTKYGKTFGYIETPNQERKLNYLSNYYQTPNNQAANINYAMKSTDVNLYQADDYVHACLEDNFTRYPETVDLFLNDKDLASGENAHSYTVRRGKSLLFDAYKVWREKALLENAILLNRLTKSSIVRNIQVEVGDMPKSQVQNTLRRLKELFEQKSAINTGNGMVEYTNPGPVENNIFTATHEGKGAITVNAIGGDVDVKNLADLDSWVNKFYAAFGIPKAYYGYTDDGAGFNGGSSLAIISSVFAKSVKRVQNSIIQALTDAINLFLLNKGVKSYINNFVLKMKTPLTQEEKDYREDLTSRISAISNMQSLFADVEDKGRKLRILKSLITTLNYGDEIIQEIDGEIAAYELQKQKEAKEAANAKTTNDGETTEGEEIDISWAEEAANESLSSNNNEVLVENIDNNTELSAEMSDIDILTEDDDLPKPSDLGDDIDFTKNN